jgi:lipopolysaccharide/colanic/teichoic acid biosynthesis glycosyltransferase
MEERMLAMMGRAMSAAVPADARMSDDTLARTASGQRSYDRRSGRHSDEADAGEAVGEYELSGALPAPRWLPIRPQALYVTRPRWRRALYRIAKRGLDIGLSLMLLVLTLPVFAVVAVLIKATSPGPVLFRHKRIGRGDKEFWCVKFRTMVVDAEEQLQRDPRLRQQFEVKFKLEDDPRLTPVGAFLRRTSIDELPQLLQVLKGDMSLIGPRPIVKPELARYGAYQQKLLTVKPGLSGFWQACGRSETTYDERVRMDMDYVDFRCLRLDLLLVLLTAVSISTRRGAR